MPLKYRQYTEVNLKILYKHFSDFLIINYIEVKIYLQSNCAAHETHRAHEADHGVICWVQDR